MSHVPTFVAWLDLETAGVDPDYDPILEVGVVLCRNEPGMPEVDRWEAVVWPGEDWWDDGHGDVSEAVREMHQKNGLWRDLEDAHQDRDDVDVILAAWLRDHTGSSDHIALAGSGVSHFDRRFIRTQLPDTDRRFTYWAYDVGVVRRLLERISPDLVRGHHGEEKAHRALADALDHRTEWLAYEQMLTGALLADLTAKASTT